MRLIAARWGRDNKVSLPVAQAVGGRRLWGGDAGRSPAAGNICTLPGPLATTLLNKPYPNASSSTVLGELGVLHFPMPAPDCNSHPLPRSISNSSSVRKNRP